MPRNCKLPFIQPRTREWKKRTELCWEHSKKKQAFLGAQQDLCCSVTDHSDLFLLMRKTKAFCDWRKNIVPTVDSLGKRQVIFICLHVCMYICMHAYMHTCIHTCIHAYMHTCIHAYMHTCIHAYMHTCIHAYMHTCIHAYIHTYIHTYMHTCIDAYMHTCIHTYMHTCIHAYMHTCIHPHWCFSRFCTSF